jgi:uncharacterized protein YaaR (DUF327 family)
MDWIVFVKKENAKKVEEILKNDEIASKQSIKIRDAKSLGFDEDGSFLLIDGTEEGIEKCKELVKEFIEEIEKERLEEAKRKIMDEEEKAMEGFGNIFG